MHIEHVTSTDTIIYCLSNTGILWQNKKTVAVKTLSVAGYGSIYIGFGL